MNAGQYKVLSSKRLGASDLCAQAAFPYTLGNLAHRVQLTIECPHGKRYPGIEYPPKRGSSLTIPVLPKAEDATKVVMTLAVLPGGTSGFGRCLGSLAGTNRSKTSLSETYAIAPRCPQLLAARKGRC